MKKIRLATAQRYLRRYGEPPLEDRLTPHPKVYVTCSYEPGEAPQVHSWLLLASPSVPVVRYIPKKAKVFLIGAGKRIAQITEGFPKVIGYFYATTGEFKQEIPY